ncbi:MAG: peptidylprolyl isomerase, partial [Hydrogenophaga sp.]
MPIPNPLRRGVLASLAVTAFLAWLPALAQNAAPRVKLTTSMGDIVLELYPDKAPKTVENFLQ